MDEDAYGDMLKIPNFDPLDRDKYRKIIDRLIVKEYIEKIVGDNKEEFQRIYKECTGKEYEWHEHLEFSEEMKEESFEKLIEEIKNHKFKSELIDERFEWMMKICKKSLNSFKKKNIINDKGSE